jgi:hypothetical protein
MVVTVFRNRLRADAQPEYSERKGRQSFYSEYRVQVCNVVHDSRVEADAKA